MGEIGPQVQLPDPDGELLIDGWRVEAARNRISRGDETVRLEPRTMAVLLCLVRKPGEVVTRQALEWHVWRGGVIGYDVLSHAVTKLRKAFGDDPKDPGVIETIPKVGYRLVAEVARASLPGRAAAGLPERADQGDSRRDAAGGTGGGDEAIDVRYCTTDDGVHLAYGWTGSGPPLIKAGSFLTHLQYDSEGILFRHWIAELSRDHRYIRYDERGNGLSDWNVEGFSFEAMVRDLETVADEIEPQRFVLLGVSQGASVAIEYAFRHPERVACLVLYGGFAAGSQHSPDEGYRARRRAMLELVRLAWGEENPAARLLYASYFLPEGTPKQQAEFNELMRRTTTPENAYKILKTFSQIDVREVAPKISTPTLVIHCRDDAIVPLESGRRMAASIPGARFVMLEGCNHIIQPNEAAWPRFLSEFRRFVAEHV